MNSFHVPYSGMDLVTEADVGCGNGLWPWVSSPVCGHVGPELVWLREGGQTGSGNIQFLMLSVQDEDQQGLCLGPGFCCTRG